MTDLSELRFFQTSEHACGYLPNTKASNIFVDPNCALDANHYSALSHCGFRRSGNYVYRPHCAGCKACIPFRVRVDEFVPSRSQRRCLRQNADLSVSLVPSINGTEFYNLYERYISSRHADGEMYPPSRSQYKSFLSCEWDVTRFIVMRDSDKKLVSVAVCDILVDGLSAMYSFFEPNDAKRSLGVYNILYQIQWAREQGHAHLYLGYWIKACRKMAYKSLYRPYELLINGQWRQQD